MKKFYYLLLLAPFLVLLPRPAKTDIWSAETVANRLHQLLTAGVPLSTDDPNFAPILSAVDAGNLSAAADLITDPHKGSPYVYNTFIPNLVQSFTRDENTDTSVHHDVQAIFMGTVRDNYPIQDILTADRIYYDPLGSPNYSANPQGNIQQAFDSGFARDKLVESGRNGFQGHGILTSNLWGQSYLQAGTNRRPIYGILHHLYCTPIETIQTLVVPDSYVRIDVPRSPGGEVDTYFNKCVSCHSWMDAFIPRAFARYDFSTQQNDVVLGLVRDKVNEVNSSVSPITSDTFNVFVTKEMQAVFGFNGIPPNRPLQNFGDTDLEYFQGQGIDDLAELIANSDGFYRCLVKRVVAEMYLKKHFTVLGYTDEDNAMLATQETYIDQKASELRSHQSLIRTIKEMAIYYLGQ